MKTTVNLLAGGMLALFCCSLANAQFTYSNSLTGATLIYSNAFDGAAVNINSNAPDYAVSLFGGTNNAYWVDALGSLSDTNALYANGNQGTAQGDSWILPFKPQTNYIYTLTASVSFAGNPGNWVGAGFAQNYAVPGTNNARYADSGVNGYDFAILTESSGNVQFFGGPHATAGIFGKNGTFPAGVGTHTAALILDTTATRWVIACFIDGVQAGTNAVPYTTTAPIAAAGITQNALTAGSQANVHWNSFTLAAVPMLIGQQPAATNISAGAAFTNSVLVAAAGPSYQWYFNSSSNYAGAIALTNTMDGRISGTTNGSLILTNIHAADAGYYYTVITNSQGSVTSSIASLGVYTTPVFVSQLPVPYTNLFTLYAGANPQFSVSASGSQPMHYQWYTNGVLFGGQTNASFTWTNVQIGTIRTYCVANNGGLATSMVWTASVIADPTAPFPSTLLSTLSLHPIGYWRLNEAEVGGGDDGVVALDYAGGNDGSYTNVELGNGGYSGADSSAASPLLGSFSANDCGAFGIQGIDFSAPSNTSVGFSVQAWVDAIGAQPNGAGIIAKGYSGAEEFALNVSNQFQFLVRDAAGNPYAATATTSPGGGWHFLVGVCDEVKGAVSLYVDGALAASVPIASGAGLYAAGGSVSIGARSSSATANNDLQLVGYMDEAAAYNYALNLYQVVELYSSVQSLPPSFTQAPPANFTVNGGGSMTLPAALTGTAPMGFYWTDVGAGTNVAAGVTNTGLPLNATLTVGNVPGAWNGDQLELTVTNAAGSTNVYVSLTVVTNLTITNNLPTPLKLLSGASYTYSIGVAGSPPYGYQWYHGGASIGGQTSATYTVTAGPVGSSSNYSVVVTNIYGSVTSAVSTLISVAAPTNAYAAGLAQLNPAGYWPMHEVEAAARGDIETNYGTLGLLGTAYYPDWAGDDGALTRQVAGAIAGDSDTALHFNYNVGNLANGAGTWTNEIYVPHTSPLSTLNVPFSVECWLYNTNSGVGQVNQSVWGQHGWEGFNAGYAGSGTGGSTISGMQLAFSSGAVTVYGYFGGVQNPIISAAAGLNAWYHVVVTCDASTNFSLYVNGNLQASGAGVGKFTPDYWTPLTIGGTRGGTRCAIITVDEFAVYTNVIADIANHYNDGTGGVAGAYVHDVTNDNPVIYLRMDAPPYAAPGTGSWPELVNYGTAANPGTYSPGTMPGIVSGPATTNGSNYIGLSATNVPAFSGVSSFADAGYATAYNPTGSNANFTVTAMFRGNPCDNRIQSIVSHGANSWLLNMTTNGDLVFNAGNGNTTSSGTGSAPGDMRTTRVYNDGNWHQVVAVNTTNVVSIYVDGVLDTSGTPAGVTPTSVIPGNSGDVLIGADPSYTSNPVGVGRQFAGQVCEVAFLNQALTAAQVTNLYNLAVAGGASVSATPVPITCSVSGNQLMMRWPLDHVGWTLQAQTNSVLGANWVDIAGSTSTNQVVVPLSPADGSVFYRLHYLAP